MIKLAKTAVARLCPKCKKRGVLYVYKFIDEGKIKYFANCVKLLSWKNR